MARVLPLRCFLFLLPNYIHNYMCIYNAIYYIYRQEESFATGILTNPNTSLSSLPMGSKLS